MDATRSYIRYGDRCYKHGDLLVTIPVYPKVRAVTGLRLRSEALFLVLFDEEEDCLRLEPVSWKVAYHCFKDQLDAALLETR